MHYYKILKHKAGFDEGTNYWEKLLARYLAATGGGKIHTTLPITFTSTSWKLVSWTIYGNNNAHNYSAEGILPLTFTSHTAGNADNWTIYGNNNIGKNLLNIESSTIPQHMTIDSVDNSTGSIVLTAESGYTYRGTSVIITNLLEIGKTYEITLTKNNATPSGQRANAALRRVDTNAIIASTGSAAFEAAGDKTFTYTHTQECAEQGVYFSLLVTGNSKTGGTVSVSNLMLREQGTSAEFEPYQQGVGAKTKNLISLAGATQTTSGTVEFTIDEANGVVTANGTCGSTTSRVFLNYTASETQYVLFSGCPAGGSGTKYDIYCWDITTGARCTRWDGTTQSDSDYGVAEREAILPAGHQIQLVVRIMVNYTADSLVFRPMFRLRGSNVGFIPYGYEIPLTVSQDGHPDQSYDIYIGNSPLTAGQSVSKASTGVDIAAIAGSNTITTELYNKPSMSIEGVDYVGVGEPVNDSWQIPLTVTHYTDNIFDKDAKNANKGYEDSTCIMWAGSIPYPYMTGNIPEDNNCFVSEKIPASPNTTYYLTDGIFKNIDNGIYSVFLWNRFRMSDYQAFPTEKTFITGDDTKFIQLCVLKSYADTVMITTKPTETYIPHVEVNNVNVPIDAPLTEGQTVSDTTEIEVFEGENTIDTTLYNKPEMEIVYE